MNSYQKASSLVAAGMVLFTLTGCSNGNSANGNSNSLAVSNENSNAATQNRIVQSQKPDNKTYEPGDHTICLLIKGSDINNVAYGTGWDNLSIEGYAVVSAVPVIEVTNFRGIFVTYVNTEKVEVEAVYNKYSEEYEFIEPGKVVVKENQKVLN